MTAFMEALEQYLPGNDEVRVVATGEKVEGDRRRLVVLFLSDERILITSDESAKLTNGFYYLAIAYDQVELFEFAKDDERLQLDLHTAVKSFHFENIEAMDEQKFFDTLFDKVGQAEFENFV